MSVAAARDRFRTRMDEPFRLFVALDGAAQLGARWMEDNVAQYADATVLADEVVAAATS